MFHNFLVIYDAQGPLRFIKKNNGPDRELAFVQLAWDENLHNKIDKSICGSGYSLPCPTEGYLRHAGKKFSNQNTNLPLTAVGDVVGLTGGFGWILEFVNGSPRSLDFKRAEINPDSKLLISIPYPSGSSVEVSALTPRCKDATVSGITTTCKEIFKQVASIDIVRSGPGNTYHLSSSGVLTFRLAETASRYTGKPEWSLPNYSTPSNMKEDVWALNRFERGNIILPRLDPTVYYHVQAICPSDSKTSPPKNGYCPQKVDTYNPDVCSAGFTQMAYDRCCQVNNLKNCIYSNGSKNF